MISNCVEVLGPSEQLIVTSIKHEDGSPPTNIIKKEPVPSSSASGSGASTSSNVNSNDSNNNNDTNDNKNSNSSGNLLLPDEKDPTNDNSITDECKFDLANATGMPITHVAHFSVLNNDDLNASGSGNNSKSSKLGMHIKSEDPATDPLAGVDSSLSNNNFGPMNPNNPSGPNRSIMSQNSPDRIQPLPSNVVNKQSNSMDVRMTTLITLAMI